MDSLQGADCDERKNYCMRRDYRKQRDYRKRRDHRKPRDITEDTVICYSTNVKNFIYEMISLS